MKINLQDLVAAHLFRKGINEDNEIHLYFILLMGILSLLLGYLYSLITFIILDVPLIVWINCVGIVINFGLLLAHRKQKYTFVASVLTIEMALYAGINNIIGGLGTHLSGYFAVAVIFQLILPYTNKWMRPVMIALCLAISVVSITICASAGPLIQLSQFTIDFTAVTNIYLVFFTILSQLYLADIANGIVARLNEMRIERLSALANTDALTGLFNRRYADQFFAIHRQQGAPTHCVAILDIDDFKFVNDTYGHDCGDDVLKFLADFLRSHLRKVDNVFRWGGEEFLLVLEGGDISIVTRVLNKLREELQRSTIPTRQGDLSITVTVGVALLENDVEASIIISDAKLYRGKRSGKNVVIA